MSYYEKLSENDSQELARLNEAVDLAVAKRREWLDAKMHELSQLKPGDPIYDLENGMRVGTVSKLYRHHESNPEFDRSLVWEYQFRVGENSYDNTGCYPGRSFGSAQQAIDRARSHAAWVERLVADETRATVVALRGER